VLCLVKQYSDLPVHLITEILPLMELVTDFVVSNPDVKVTLPLHMLSSVGIARSRSAPSCEALRPAGLARRVAHGSFWAWRVLQLWCAYTIIPCVVDKARFVAI
jgi:hypothetical protein